MCLSFQYLTQCLGGLMRSAACGVCFPELLHPRPVFTPTVDESVFKTLTRSVVTEFLIQLLRK